MALNPFFTNRFEKDIKRSQKRNKDLSKLKTVIELLTNEKPLEPKHHDHNLIGNYAGARECHIEPDWLLIYLIEGDNITFTRTGTHSDLF